MNTEVQQAIAAKFAQMQAARADGQLAQPAADQYVMSDQQRDSLVRAAEAAETAEERPAQYEGVPLPNPAQGSSANGSPPAGPEQQAKDKTAQLRRLHDGQPDRPTHQQLYR